MIGPDAIHREHVVKEIFIDLGNTVFQDVEGMGWVISLVLSDIIVVDVVKKQKPGQQKNRD